mmetsp:Transcript_24716/g.79811  ORF Transcript_24716/g.79811 Transcript_24716/m.79811 type:complete len:249 (+) Transcript_24716:33-779(+)
MSRCDRGESDTDPDDFPAAPTLAMPKLTFVYARLHALGEPIRMTAAAAGVPLENVFVWDYYGKPWPEVKPTLPFGQVPELIIEEGGKTTKLYMSTVITRYIATIGKALPEDPVDAAYLDMMMERVHELFLPLNPSAQLPPYFSKQQEGLEKVEVFLKQVEPMVAAKGGPFLLGKKPYYADYGIYHHMDIALTLKANVLDNFPAIKMLVKAVEQVNGVKQYLASRPKFIGSGTDPKLVYDGVPKAIGFA